MKVLLFLATTCQAAKMGGMSYCYEGTVAKSQNLSITKGPCGGVIPACMKLEDDLEYYYKCVLDILKFSCEETPEVCRFLIHEAFSCARELCNASTSVEATAILVMGAAASAWA